MGYKIRDIRKNKKMSQQELEKKSGVSRGTISALETGKERATSTKTLMKIAGALEVTIDELFC